MNEQILITTVTPNPAVDKAVWLTELARGKCNRVISTRQDPGGKGINIVKVLKGLNMTVLALGFFGGAAGRGLIEDLRKQEIAVEPVIVSGETRTNIKIIENSQEIVTEINEPGPLVSKEEQDALVAKVAVIAEKSKYMVFAGSLPEGCKPDYYVRLISAAKKHGCKTVLDASGDALKKGLCAAPFIIKPNQFELAEICQTEIDNVYTAASVARDIRKVYNIGLVVVSLGSRGAIIIGDTDAYYAKPPKVKSKNTVGAGDSMVAGLIYSLTLGRSLAEALRFGTATGTLAAMDAATSVSKPEIQKILELVDSVQVTRLD